MLFYLGQEVEVNGCILKIIGYYTDFGNRKFRDQNQQSVALGEYVSNLIDKVEYYSISSEYQNQNRDITILDKDEYENWILPYHEEINFLNCIK